VPILALDQVVAAELFLGFRERPIRDDRFSVSGANGDGTLVLVELCAGQQSTTRLEFVEECSIFAHDPSSLRIRKLPPPGFVKTAHQHVLHGFSPVDSSLTGVPARAVVGPTTPRSLSLRQHSNRTPSFPGGI